MIFGNSGCGSTLSVPVCLILISRVVPLCFPLFSDLVNSFHHLKFGYLVGLQMLFWVGCCNVPLYLYLDWLVPENILNASHHWVFCCTSVSLIFDISDDQIHPVHYLDITC